ncbi:MAG: hypothetical protein FWC13_05295 [Oscillospiraceae bacterium]|nr:hypothetical protein [Oscillospiraceae bacterium]
MEKSLILRFKNATDLRIGIEENSTLDITRHGRQTSINVTNAEKSFTLNALYDEILERAEVNETFDIELCIDSMGTATFPNMGASYHLHEGRELLSFQSAMEDMLITDRPDQPPPPTA